MTAFRPVPATGFMPLAAVFDLDHTLIAGDATIGWTEYLYERGVVTDPVFREINERMKASYHAGTIDVIASGISITEERQKKVDFTSPYYQSGLSYLVRKADAEKIKTFADLKGKTLAVQIGTTGAAYAKNVEGARVSAFNTTSEAFMDLNVKNADAVVLDRPVLAYFLKTKPRVAKNLQLSTEIADAEHFGFAVKKGNAELLQKLNAALEELKKSGEFTKIEDKWFAK